MRLFCRNERGALLYVFAIMFPVMLVLFALALDGANSMRTRARLNDAVKQGLYGVAVKNPREESFVDEQKLMSNYVMSYLPNLKAGDITVKMTLADMKGDSNTLPIYVDPLSNGIGDFPKYKYTADVQIKQDRLIGLSFLGHDKGGKIGINSDKHAIEGKDKPYYTVGSSGFTVEVQDHKRFGEPGGADTLYATYFYEYPNAQNAPNLYEPASYWGYIHHTNGDNFPTTAFDQSRITFNFNEFLFSRENIKEWSAKKIGGPSGIMVKFAGGGGTIKFGTEAIINGETVWLDDKRGYMKYLVTGPTATAAQHNSANPGWVAAPKLPATFLLEGKYKGKVLISHQFTIRNWYLVRDLGKLVKSCLEAKKWCDSTQNYRLVKLTDLVNGSYPLLGWKGEYNYPPTEAFPEGKLIHEIIGGPLFAEWQYNFRYSGFLVGGVGERIWTSTPSLMHPAKNYVVGSQGSDPKAKGLYEAYYQLPGGQTQEGATVICISNNSQGFD